MQEYMKNFASDEEGIETIEFIGMLAVVAVMIAALIKIGGQLSSKAKAGGDAISGVMQGAIDQMG